MKSRFLISLAVCIIALSSLAAWHALSLAYDPGEASFLKKVADVALPGSATRFDYQSFDLKTGRLYLSHMGDGHLVVFDTKTNKVIANLPGFPSVTGVLFVPDLKRVYASAAGSHQVVSVDATSLKILASIAGARFPDGLAYAPKEQKVFVSDESGGADLVIDAVGNRRIGRIPLGGEAGNTQYDSVANRIFVAVQTRNEMAAIDPKTDRIVARYNLPGSDFPHGFTIDAPHRLMFVSCEGNARLLVVNMHTMAVTATFSVGNSPDVLAFDPGQRRLYVSSEAGTVSVFEETGANLKKLGDVYAPNAHTISVDPQTHRIYLPLKNVGGQPVLRIMEPTQ